MMDDLIKYIDLLIQQRPFCREALSAYGELISLMKGIEPGIHDFDTEERLKDIKTKEGFPLFSRDDLPLDLEASSGLLKLFLKRLAENRRNDRDGLRKALESADSDPGWTEGVFKSFLCKDENALSRMGVKAGLEPKVLEFLAQTALRPSLQLLRRSCSEKMDKKGWDHGYCPLCGSQPNMAFFDKTGKRHLHCELCGEDWAYPRLKCPFCENEEHDTLGYFEGDQEEGFRVDFCRKCERYIKTIDKRLFEEPAPMELEYIATIYLDILANEHGFK